MYDLEFLVKALQKAKTVESSAKAERMVLEERVASLVETKEAGQKTITLASGVKVTVKRGFNYKTDIDGMRDAFASIGFPAPIKTETKHTLDVEGYEWYRGLSSVSEVFKEISSYVTVTPKKVAVLLKVPTL